MNGKHITFFVPLQMEDGDSDKNGAGHILTAWLGELDTLKKVNREEAE